MEVNFYKLYDFFHLMQSLMSGMGSSALGSTV
jgi:hypothetical protein